MIRECVTWALTKRVKSTCSSFSCDMDLDSIQRPRKTAHVIAENERDIKFLSNLSPAEKNPRGLFAFDFLKF